MHAAKVSLQRIAIRDLMINKPARYKQYTTREYDAKIAKAQPPILDTLHFLFGSFLVNTPQKKISKVVQYKRPNQLVSPKKRR